MEKKNVLWTLLVLAMSVVIATLVWNIGAALVACFGEVVVYALYTAIKAVAREKALKKVLQDGI